MKDSKPTPDDQRLASFFEPCNCYGELADKTRARLAEEFARVRAEEREACARLCMDYSNTKRAVADELEHESTYCARASVAAHTAFMLAEKIRARGTS